MKKLYASRKAVFLLLTFLSSYIISNAQAPTITFATIATGYTVPVSVTNAADGSNRLFVIQQNGIIMVRNGAVQDTFANFGPAGANIVLYGGEQGLLSMAFHPQYNGTTNRYFFIYHDNLAGDIEITRCQTLAGNPDTADLSTITSIIIVPHPTNANHNGGQVNFGPDGYLYFATGDGGGGNDNPNNAQTGTVLLGKMIRLDIDNASFPNNYAIPADNPYVTDAAVDDRIWALGLRNPYRWSFDRLTGDMWIGDVGQNAREEIDYRPAGNTGHVNYGWRCFEGYISTPGVADCTPTDYVPPVFDYPNPDSGQAVNGGFVYRGTEFPNLYGRYIAADVYTGYVFILSPNGSGGFDSTSQDPGLNFVVGFGEAEDGSLYAVSQATNTLYKVVAIGGSPLPVTIKTFSGAVNSGYNDLNWETASELNTSQFHIEYSHDGSHFTRAGTVPAARSINGSHYDYRHYTDNREDIQYRLAIQDDHSAISYSKIIRLNGTKHNAIRIFPTVISNRTLNIELNGKSLNRIRLINTNGMTVLKKDINTFSNNISIPLPSLSKGIYIAELSGDGILQTERIVIQ